MMKASRITQAALLAAVALIFGYIESLFPLPVAIPGVKLGLSNIVILFAVLKTGKREAALIMLLKVTLSSLLWSGMSGFIYSISGGILSLLAMLLLKKQLSTVGLSVLGGICHNLGQLSSAALMLGTLSVFYYLPVLILSGVIVGLATGIACHIIITRLEKSGFC